MILVAQFLLLNQAANFKKMYFVVIQLASLLAVILLYFNPLNPFIAETKKEAKNMGILD